MFIDKKGRLLGKISIIDILFVVILLASVLFALNKFGLFSPKAAIVNTDDKIELVFYQEEINNFSATNVKVGDPSTEALQNNSFGTVTDIKIGDSISWGSDVEGNQVSASREGYSSIYITLESRGTVGPNGVTIGSSTYYIGEIITLRVGTTIFFGRISDAKKI